MRPVKFRSTKFCQSLPNFKDAVVLPRSRTNFCQAWNLTDLLINTPWFEGKCQSRKFDLYFQSEYWSPKPAKIISRTRTLLDYEQSLFFLSPSRIEQNARECARAWLEARDGTGCRPRFSLLAASPLDARTEEEELKKKRDCSQSRTLQSNKVKPPLA